MPFSKKSYEYLNFNKFKLSSREGIDDVQIHKGYSQSVKTNRLGIFSAFSYQNYVKVRKQIRYAM